MSKKNKVLIIGAGISGLAAAKNLNDSGYDVTILEAKDRIGGRLYTDRSLGVPLEVGANWIHDNNPETNPIMKIKKELGLKAHKCSVAGPNVSFEVLDNTDQWVQEGILDYLNLLDVHSISGNGASISAGIIMKPSDNLNIGINYESKAGITLEEELYSELESKYFDYYFEPEDTTLRNAISGTGSNFANYKYKSPSKITIGSSYFYKKFGFISADIDLIDYSSSRIQSYDFNDFMENKEIGLLSLKFVEIIGEDEIYNLDPETIYFITNILNQAKLIKFRNKVLSSALPFRT